LSTLLALQLLAHCNGQFEGLTRDMENSFSKGFETVPSLANYGDDADKEFNQQLVATINAHEQFLLGSAFFNMTMLLRKEFDRVLKFRISREGQRRIMNSTIPRLFNSVQFISIYRALHYDGNVTYRNVSEKLTLATTSHAIALRSALADPNIAIRLTNYVMPSPYSMENSNRSKRAIPTATAWACRLARLSSFMGTSNSTKQRVANFILNRVPARWRNQFMERLAHGSASGLTRLAGAVCGVLSPTFTENRPNALMALYQSGFMDVHFDRFLTFVNYYQAAVGNGMMHVKPELTDLMRRWILQIHQRMVELDS